MTGEKYDESDPTIVARPQMDCSAGPPTVSDTGIPTDQNSVGGDYVLILASSTKIRLANKNEQAFCAQQYVRTCWHSRSSCLFLDDRCFPRRALLRHLTVRKSSQDRRFSNCQQEIRPVPTPLIAHAKIQSFSPVDLK
jgi:hypothetical protein